MFTLCPDSPRVFISTPVDGYLSNIRSFFVEFFFPLWHLIGSFSSAKLVFRNFTTFQFIRVVRVSKTRVIILSILSLIDCIILIIVKNSATSTPSSFVSWNMVKNMKRYPLNVCESEIPSRHYVLVQMFLIITRLWMIGIQIWKNRILRI